jgi:glutamine amidotransferase
VSVRLALIDSGVANLGSVRAALDRLGIASELTTDASVVGAASHVILPGVGAAPPAMRRLEATGLARVIPQLRQPVLGICLGMQLLFEHTAEGEVDCLGVIPGRLERLDPARAGRVPHMGWNRLDVVRDSPLTDGFGAEAYAYFVHSYAAPLSTATLASVSCGSQRISAVVAQGNFYGAQFHPERSAAIGARLLKNFVQL